MGTTINNKPPMTGNGKHTTYKNCDLGMVYGTVLPTFYTPFFYRPSGIGFILKNLVCSQFSKPLYIVSQLGLMNPMGSYTGFGPIRFWEGLIFGTYHFLWMKPMCSFLESATFLGNISVYLSETTEMWINISLW